MEMWEVNRSFPSKSTSMSNIFTDIFVNLTFVHIIEDKIAFSTINVVKCRRAEETMECFIQVLVCSIISMFCLSCLSEIVIVM